MIMVAYCNTANRACSLLYSYIKTYNEGIWLLPVNVCPDVPLTFCLAGVEFEFVDINPQTLCIDEEECMKRLRVFDKEYAGIVYVRTYGCLIDSSHFFADCKVLRPSLRIVDDRCLCLPERYPSFFNSDMILYSTGHCKQIDLGGGGLAYYKSNEKYDIDPNLKYDRTDEEAVYKQAYSKNRPLNHIPQGWLLLNDYVDYESYMKEIMLKKEQRILQREKINEIYKENLPQEIQFVDAYNQWRFNIRVPFHLKDTILRALFDNKLFASNHYHSANRLFDSESYPYSDDLYASVINLFNDTHYTEGQAFKTTTIIKQILLYGTHSF